jgi:exopolysaccharide biosynthesis polyprenyl glycosylphosphotransferase
VASTADPSEQDQVPVERPLRVLDQIALDQRCARTAKRLFDGTPWATLRAACDAILLAVGCIAGVLVTPNASNPWLLVAFPPLAMCLLYSRGRYHQSMRDVVLDSIAPGFGAVSISAMAILGLELLAGARDADTSSLVASVWVASLAGLTLAGGGLTLLQQQARRRGSASSPTLVIGADATGVALASRLEQHPEYGLSPIGFLDGARTDGPSHTPPVLGDLGDLEDVVAAYGVRNVIIGFPDCVYSTTMALVSRCDQLGVHTQVLPRLSASMNRQTRIEYLGTLPLMNLRAVNPESWRFAFKHGFDRIAALALLVVLSPLLVLIAVAVRVSSPGPVLFRQQRAGRDGRVFGLLKFRTMLAGDDDVAYERDPGVAPGGVEGLDRRTRVGRILRRTSVDELPQLINVLRGEMSIVGPRPERPEFAELFRQEVERYHDRHRVRSGITGWAQVHGLRGQTPLADRVELDNFYIEHWSLALDVKILLLTIPALLRGS